MCFFKLASCCFCALSAPNTEPPQWEGLIGELAEFLLENVSQELANPNLLNDDELKVLRSLAGFSWSEAAVRRVSAL